MRTLKLQWKQDQAKIQSTATLWNFQTQEHKPDQDQDQDQEQPRLKEHGQEQPVLVSNLQIASMLAALLCEDRCSLTKLQLWSSPTAISTVLSQRRLGSARSEANVTSNFDIDIDRGRGAGVVFGFAAALPHNTTLQVLHLRCAGIEDSGAEQLGNGLRNNATLTSLKLPMNSIGDKGASYLAEALRTVHHVRNVRTVDNNFRDEKHEDIYTNGCIDEGAGAGGSLGEDTDTDIDTDIGATTQSGSQCRLRTIDLSRNWVGDAGAMAFAAVLRDNRTLTKLKIPFNAIGAVRMCHEYPTRCPFPCFPLFLSLRYITLCPFSRLFCFSCFRYCCFFWFTVYE